MAEFLFPGQIDNIDSQSFRDGIWIKLMVSIIKVTWKNVCKMYL